MEILGRRVMLRPVVAADAAGLAAILETPEVARWWPAYDRARVEAEFWIAPFTARVLVPTRSGRSPATSSGSAAITD